jgi:hypothetical protein
VNDLNNSIKDLLGSAYKLEFCVPFDATQTLKADTTFGLQPDLSIRTGLVVQATSAVKLKAAFKGQLFFEPPPFQGVPGSLLRLRIVPAEALSLRAVLPAEVSSPVELFYGPVDQAGVEAAMKAVLKSQGLSGTKLADVVKTFLEGDGVGILVNAGQEIGPASETTATLEFEGADGLVLHPLYLLWQWRQLGQQGKLQFKPANHPMINALQLDTLVLALQGGNVINQVDGLDLGPHSFVIP